MLSYAKKSSERFYRTGDYTSATPQWVFSQPPHISRPELCVQLGDTVFFCPCPFELDGVNITVIQGQTNIKAFSFGKGVNMIFWMWQMLRDDLSQLSLDHCWLKRYAVGCHLLLQICFLGSTSWWLECHLFLWYDKEDCP